jgi:hypothetical protein
MKKRILILVTLLVCTFAVSFGENIKASGASCPYMQSCSPTNKSPCGTNAPEGCECRNIGDPYEPWKPRWVCGT